MKTIALIVGILAFSGSAFAANDGMWTRGPGSRTVTIDTRGINAGTAAGQRAILAAQSIVRESSALGNRTSAGAAQSFNSRATSVAAQVSSVATADRAKSRRYG